MPAVAVTALNRQSLRTLGLYTRHTTNRYGGLQVTWSVEGLPGAGGAMVGGPRRIGPRRLQMEGTVIAESPDLLQAKLDVLHDLFLSGTVTLESGYQGREIDVVLDGQLQIDPASDPELRSRAARLTAPLLAPFPYWTAKNWLPLSFGTTRKPVPTGRAPSPGIITLRGADNPIITYRSGDGTVVRTLGLTWTRAANESCDIDLRPTYLSITRRSAAGVLSSGEDLLSSGGFFAIDPQDGNPDMGIYPTLEVSAGSGVLLYPLAYP